MRKLQLNKETLAELTTDDLALVIGATGTTGVFNLNTVKDTECGDQCLNTTPINQCLLTIGCNNTA